MKKRGIAKKPTGADKAAADWVQAGGTDPELEQSNAQESKHLPSGVLAKSKDSTYKRTTLYLPKALHKRLKNAATDEEIEMSDIAEEAIAAWLDRRSDA